MLSRVADALYWLSRYVERAENTTRLLLVTEDFATETQGLAEDLAQTAWKDLLAVYPSSQLTRPVSAFAPLSLPYLLAFFLDAGNPYSIHFSLRKARENARAVREALTVEAFTAVNETFRAVEAHERKGLHDLPGLRDALNETHKGLFSLVGAIASTFTRDEGWLFLRLGESLERMYRAALVMRAKLPALLVAAPRPDADLTLYYTQWRSLLRSLSSFENYRRVCGARLDPGLVVPFLLFDGQSPHSLRATAHEVKLSLERLAGPEEPSPPARLIGTLHAQLTYERERVVVRGDYLAFLDQVLDAVGRTHDAVATQYFAT